MPSTITVNPRPEELAGQLVERSKAGGADLVGPDGLMGELTKRVLEASLEPRWMSISALRGTTLPGGIVGTRVTAPVRRR